MIDEQSRQTINRLKALTPARIGVGRSGTRPPTSALISFWADHAEAKDAVKSNLSQGFIETFCRQYRAISVKSLAQNREEFILFPPRGKRLDAESLDILKNTMAGARYGHAGGDGDVVGHVELEVDSDVRGDVDSDVRGDVDSDVRGDVDSDVRGDVDVQIVVSDGLSAMAVEENVPDLYPVLVDGFADLELTLARPVIVHFGRVAVADQIAHLAGAKIAINLIGERPGLSCATGLSAYITYNPNPQTTISSDRTVVSNIHNGGTPAVEAGAFIVKVVERILQSKVSGVKLQALG
jgi:ethanolamine ammonia-lyase small subunit